MSRLKWDSWIGSGFWEAFYIVLEGARYTPYYPCMLYLPPFAIQINQMQVNIPYMDGMGTSFLVSSMYYVHPSFWGKIPIFTAHCFQFISKVGWQGPSIVVVTVVVTAATTRNRFFPHKELHINDVSMTFCHSMKHNPPLPTLVLGCPRKLGSMVRINGL